MLIITGTQDSNDAAGVGKALAAHLKCLEKGGVTYTFVPTYVAGSFLGKFVPWMFAIPKIIVLLLKLKRSQRKVWLHPGAGISRIREGLIGLISKLLGAKVYWHVHSLSTIKALSTRLGSCFFRLVTISAADFVVLTKWWKNRLEQSGIKKNIHIIPNPIEVENTTNSNKNKGSSTTKVFVACRIVNGKGVDVVCRAAKKTNENVRIQIAGDGPERESLEQYVHKNGLSDRVSFTGWLTQLEMNNAMESADVFCLPTQKDSFGMVFIEAMKHGLPIIASNWQAIPDVVPDGEVGILVDPTDENEVAQAINKLAEDADLRSYYSANSLRVVKERYSIEAITPQLVNLFGEEDGSNL